MDIKAEYIEKVEENQEMLENFGLNINEEDEIENSFLRFHSLDNFESLISFYREFRAIINNITVYNSFDYWNNYIRDIKKKFV